MKKILGFGWALLSAGALIAAEADDFAAWVDPHIGASATGHTTVAAAYPLGMIQAGPDTGNYSWDYCSGYRDADRSLYGFSHTHLSGTGCCGLGDLLLLPTMDEVPEVRTPVEFDKASEVAEPGHYAVTLKDGIRCEVAVAVHSAIWRFNYPRAGICQLVVDPQWGLVDTLRKFHDKVVSNSVEVAELSALAGQVTTHEWAPLRTWAYRIETSVPRVFLRELKTPGEAAPRYVLGFELKEGETLTVKLALSSVSPEGARKNLQAEVAQRDFNEVKAAARAAWNGYLGRIEIAGVSDDVRTSFYTSMYHLFFQPNELADVDGRYRGNDWGKIHVAKSGHHYTTLSLWDTFRAAHPLYTIIAPELVDDLVNSMLDQGEQFGFLPMWTEWGQETQCMIGTHSVPVIVDAYLKGFRGFDAERAMAMIDNTLRAKHDWRPAENWNLLDKYGYFPCDLIRPASVSRTLECDYDDACAARMARALGQEATAEFFERRSQGWRELFDARFTQTMRGKDSLGRWFEPFDPYMTTYYGLYTEANAYQYTYHVMQDPRGLIAAFGSKVKFYECLDKFFSDCARCPANNVLDATGMIGQYSHGNEPSQHIIYFYALDGYDLKRTGELVRQVVTELYQPRPDGLCGNDDCGQMSAWYVLSVMGFYPFDPCGADYVPGVAQFPKLTVKLPEGKRLEIVSRVPWAEGRIQARRVAAKFNDRTLAGNLSHADLMQGGKLEFVAGE